MVSIINIWIKLLLIFLKESKYILKYIILKYINLIIKSLINVYIVIKIWNINLSDVYL